MMSLATLTQSSIKLQRAQNTVIAAQSGFIVIKTLLRPFYCLSIIVMVKENVQTCILRTGGQLRIRQKTRYQKETRGTKQQNWQGLFIVMHNTNVRKFILNKTCKVIKITLCRNLLTHIKSKHKHEGFTSVKPIGTCKFMT